MKRARVRTIAAAACMAAPLVMFAGGVPVQAAGLTTTAAEWSFPAGQTGISDIAKSIRADVAYQQGYTGKGVGVALIDTGVAPVPGLTSGNIVNGPDLSLESQVPGLLHKDGYGHGTHMAGIIAGRDSAGGTGFRGIAPDAKVTSIKVGMSNGAVDVSQMLAAIDWVVKHRNDDPKNPIRVLNLSYGTDSTLGQASNPLSLAVENAWWAGIVVVVAAGNTGYNLTVPATDMHPIIVGSTDPQGTTNPADDTVSDFVSWQGRTWPIDVVVPGRSVVSLRDPGSYADTYYPSARVGDRFFKGSGTSQAAAVVSGACALILQKYPSATPWQIRSQFWDSSTPLPKATVSTRGELNLTNIFNGGVGTGWQTTTKGTGDGSLQQARGTSVVTSGGAPLTGENDIFGPFSTAAWAKASNAGTSWQGGSWMGHPWTGNGWTATTDGQANWAGTTWSGRAWSGRAWSDVAWAGRAWSGRAWSGDGFSGASWSGVSWSGALWK